MTQDNPETKLEQYVPTLAEETAFRMLAEEHRNLSPDDFNKSQDDLNKQKRATFEYAMERLQTSDWASASEVSSQWNSINKATHELQKQLEFGVRSVRGGSFHEYALQMWISELIQNAIDARWSVEQELEIEIELSTDKSGGLCLEFSHNGRPPQSLGFSTNELKLMLQLGGTKSIDFSTVGEFGIGFKIWTLLFDVIEIKHGHGHVVCKMNDTIQTKWVSSKEERFTVRAMGAKEDSNFSSLMDGTNPSEARLLEWFKRTFDGLKQRNEPCTIRVKKDKVDWISFTKKRSPVSEGLMKAAEEVTPHLIVEAWNVTGVGVEGFVQTGQQIISFTQSITDQTQREELRDVITHAFQRAALKNEISAIHRAIGERITLDEYIKKKAEEATKRVSINLNLSDTAFVESELQYSLFSIKPSGIQKSRKNRFFAFQGNYKVNRSRENFDQGNKKYNHILRGVAMNLFLDVLKLLTRHPNLLEEAGLSMDAYQSMLDAFGRGSSEEDPSIKHWTESVNLDTMHQLLGPEGTACWPTSHDTPLTYSQLSYPRPRLVEFLNHDDPTISEWAKETLRDDEAVYLHEGEGDGTWLEYTWSLGEDHPYTLHAKQQAGGNSDHEDSPEKRPVQPLPAALRKQLQDELLKEEEE